MDAAKSVTATFLPKTVSLAVAKAGTGSGAVTSSAAGIDCGPTCSTSYANGTQVTLTAAPAQASDLSTFAGWSGACSQAGTSPICTLTLTQDTVVTANFQRVDVSVQVGRSPGQPPGGDPTLTTSLSARPSCGPISSIRFGEAGHPFDNARVTITAPAGGPAGQTTGFTSTPPPGTTTVTFTIQRVVPSGAAAVGPIFFYDGCGEWKTFVGGGPDAFR